MRLAQMLYAVLDKTAPMPEQDIVELKNDASLWYKTQLDKAQDKQEQSQELDLKDKAILQAETWYMRTIFAIGYIYLVRVIQDFMNPPKVKYIDDDEEFQD